ncbi:S-layer homology domain-containing protein [Paenibacillus sp. GP183]|uniref:S-layer homology domain-containing protein n=1 Tax=Paenibacillus sp. GP183 TaxID=1882751 RepID=UPI000896676B|nr:S-layer homology domain-containing protein [Paenibacillus sp. GP183]SED12886.1 S-layer homology domain-containing protein [Paenibacillus sp. GP183]
MIKQTLFSILAFSVFMVGCEAQNISATGTLVVTSTKANVNLSDISNHWASDAINKAVQKGYVDGYEDATFRPELNVSRAEFLKMAITAMKLPITGDTTGSEWYKPYIAAATDKGILRPTDFPSADISKPITRLEMARISVRSTDDKLQDKDAQIEDKLLMYNAAKAGLIQGLSYGELAPEKSTTRAQSVTIIERILTVNGGGKLEVDKYALSNAEIAWHKTNIVTVLPRYFSNGIGEYTNNNFKAENMYFSADNGNFINETMKLVVVDMSDPTDPNRGLVPSDLKWWGSDRKYRSIPSNSYVILGINHIKVSKKYGISPAYQFGEFTPGHIVPKNVDLNAAYAKDPDTLLDLEVADSVSKVGDRAIEINYPGHEFNDLREQDYTTAFVLPKGDLFAENVDQIFVINYYPSSDFNGKPVRLFESKLDPNIHQ